MTDHARTDDGAPVLSSQLRPRPSLATSRLEKVLTFTPPAPEAPPAAEAKSPNGSRDWSSSLQLIEEAGEAMRISEERVTEVEAELERVLQHAGEEIRRLTTLLSASEQKVAKTEERLRAAEARAAEADTWLIRLNDAVFNAFPAMQDRRAERGPDTPGPSQANA